MKTSAASRRSPTARPATSAIRVAVVIAETLLRRPRTRRKRSRSNYGVLPAVADPEAAAENRRARKFTTSRPTTRCSTGISAIQGGDGRRFQIGQPHSPRSTSSTIASCRRRSSRAPRSASMIPGLGAFTLWTHVAKSACRTSRHFAAFCGMAPEHKLRVIAPDVGGGFGSKIFIYAEEIVGAVGVEATRPSGEMGRRSHRGISCRCARPRSRDPRRTCVGQRWQDHRSARQDDRQSRRLSMQLFSSAVPTYLYATTAVGPVRHPKHLCRGRRGLHQHRRRSTPIAARGGRKRRSWSSASSRLRRARRDSDPVGVAAQELRHESSRIRRRWCSAYDAGDYDAALKKALELADYKGFGKRKREAARHGKLRGIGFSTYIEACGLAPSQAVGALGGGVGQWESAEVRVNPTGSVEVLTGSHSHGQGHETTFAQVVSDRLGIPIENISVLHGDTDKVQFGMGTYGSRSGAVGMSAVVKALDKVEAKAKKVAAHLLEAAEGDIEFKDGKFSVAGTDKSAAWGDVALNAYIAAQILRPGARAGPQGDGVLGPDQLYFSRRLPHLRGRSRSGNRQQ